VGLAFLVATWWLVLRGDEYAIREHGLSLGGLLEPLAIDKRRILRDTLVAVLWVLLFAAIVFPPFWFGFKLFWHAKMPFVWRVSKSPLEDVAGQLLVVALPEEAFFRGYLQTRLDAAWGKRVRIFGAELGWGWIVSAVIFAIGHLLTTPNPARLAVFFPALLFGWLRARTGGIGAGVLFHASCNLFSATLARGYGFSS
jgi:membrane protease YdiL (CAAX protease family)